MSDEIPKYVISLDEILKQKTVNYDQNIAILSGIDSGGNLIAVSVEDVTGKLNVSGITVSAGDIEIGAVEIKDGTTDTRVKVKTDGADNAVVVMVNKGSVLNVPVVSVTTSAALAVAANPNRKSIHLKNMGSDVIYIADAASDLATVATSGWPLAIGDIFSDDTYKGDIYAKSASGTQALRTLEVSA